MGRAGCLPWGTSIQCLALTELQIPKKINQGTSRQEHTGWITSFKTRWYNAPLCVLQILPIWGKRNENNCVSLAEGYHENAAGSASSRGLEWELLPGTHLGEWGSTLIYSAGIKWRTRRFSPPSQAPTAGSHHPHVIPREMPNNVVWATELLLTLHPARSEL